MKVLVLLLAITVQTWALPHANPFGIVPQDDEDADLSVVELIAKYGYPVEEHFMTTSDGYILRLHRIPHGKDTDVVSDRVAFVMHGIISSSADWIIAGPGKGLGYLLADAGYDVWMGNARGNHESRNHTALDPDNNPEFWYFSWHQIGYYDIPEMIDYILAHTGQSQLFHLGHSQGTTSFYVMASDRPEYNDKVKAHFSMAPIAYMNHMTSPLLHIIAFWGGPLEVLASLIGMDEFLPSNDFMELVGDLLCGDDDITQVLCTNVLFALCGFSPDEMNATMLPVIMGHTPAGSSVRQLMHYAQLINSGTFRHYDYQLDNIIIYGSLTPPPYDSWKITTPMYIYFSRNDWLSAETDVLRFCSDVGEGCKELILVGDGNFNHIDYLFGISAPEYVYLPIIEKMSNL